jgi:hypothetical protein
MERHRARNGIPAQRIESGPEPAGCFDFGFRVDESRKRLDDLDGDRHDRPSRFSHEGLGSVQPSEVMAMIFRVREWTVA